MSWEATAYVKKLYECPDGAEITRGQKLLLFVLADYHNTSQRAAWPHLDTMANESLSSRSSTKRDLDYLEEHLVLQQRHPEGQGRGKRCTYVFLSIDEPERLKALLASRKGVQDGPLFSPGERGPEGVQAESERGPKIEQRGSEGVRKGSRDSGDPPQNKQSQARTRTRTLEHNYKNGNITPEGALYDPAKRAALQAWIELKDQDLKAALPESEWKLWVRPAYLLRVLGSDCLLVALPPNNQIVEAASARLAMVRELAAKRGYGLSLTKYPDGYQLERIRTEHPEFYAQMYGNRQREARGDV